jgi:hypothetical protein
VGPTEDEVATEKGLLAERFDSREDGYREVVFTKQEAGGLEQVVEKGRKWMLAAMGLGIIGTIVIVILIIAVIMFFLRRA